MARRRRPSALGTRFRAPAAPAHAATTERQGLAVEHLFPDLAFDEGPHLFGGRPRSPLRHPGDRDLAQVIRCQHDPVRQIGPFGGRVEPAEPAEQRDPDEQEVQQGIAEPAPEPGASDRILVFAGYHGFASLHRWQ
ncbi:hypothetical protein [Microvirga ossetica]|uniref:hypothetical protein n=1 Tax=Microvirga ossetica TaxID=1882682 RepID=UPI001F34AC6A|nr:hypothetical protein [Microvirga ossetica]